MGFPFLMNKFQLLERGKTIINAFSEMQLKVILPLILPVTRLKIQGNQTENCDQIVFELWVGFSR